MSKPKYYVAVKIDGRWVVPNKGAECAVFVDVPDAGGFICWTSTQPDLFNDCAALIAKLTKKEDNE